MTTCGVLVETGRPEPLDVVELGKRSAGARRAIGLIFVARLADEIGAVGEKQDAPEAGVREQPVG